jgi:hypothetical protein
MPGRPSARAPTSLVSLTRITLRVRVLSVSDPGSQWELDRAGPCCKCLESSFVVTETIGHGGLLSGPSPSPGGRRAAARVGFAPVMRPAGPLL